MTSCKKWKYDEVRIHGKVMNGCLGVPMSDEQVDLVEVRGEFLGPGNGKTLKTVTTNSNGEYDFGGLDLRKKDKFKYYVNYVHRGITTAGFCDSYEVDKTAIDQDKNLVVFVGGGMVFQVLPDMSVLGVNDSIKIEVVTSTDYSVFYCNANASEDYTDKKYLTLDNSGFLPNGRGGPFYGGNGYYFIKLRKNKAGVIKVSEDTVLVSGSYTYNINW